MTAALSEQNVVQPYLFFEGNCEAALDFYKEKLGAEVLMLLRFGDNPEPQPGIEAPSDKIMHAAFKIGPSLIMASDGYCAGATKFDGFMLSLTARDADEAERLFAALTEDGGEIRMPLNKTFFSPRFGMATDRFGVGWMVVTTDAGAPG